jgi:hypothetical protein
MKMAGKFKTGDKNKEWRENLKLTGNSFKSAGKNKNSGKT